MESERASRPTSRRARPPAPHRRDPEPRRARARLAGEIEANTASFINPEKSLEQAFCAILRCARVRRGRDLVRVPARGEQARRNLLEREHAVVVGVDAVELDPEEPPRVAGVLLRAVAWLGAVRAGLALREEPGLQDRGGCPHRLL